jgi:lysine 2,3-aminomutase
VEILEQLRGHTSGLAVPHLAIDLPDGGGKVTLQPTYLLALGEKESVFRNYRNEIYRYPEPEERDCTCPYDEIYFSA